MLDVTRMIAEGGPIMYVLLLVGFAFPVVWLVTFATLALKIRLPSLFWVGMLLLPVGLGAVGSMMGMNLAMEAVAFASSEMVDKLSAAGISVALYTTVFGAYIAALGLAIQSLATGLGVAIRPGENAGFTAIPAVVGLFVCAVGTLALVVMTGFGSALIFAVASFGMVLAGARYSADNTKDQGRVGAARAAVGFYVTLTCVALAIGAATNAYVGSYGAQAHASAETRDMLVAQALDGYLSSQAGLWGVAVFVGVMTILLVGPGFRAIGLRGYATGLLNLGVVGFNLLLVAAIFYVGGPLFESAVPFSSVRADALGALGVELPPATREDVTSELSLSSALTITGSGALLDGEPHTGPVRDMNGGKLLLEADPATPLADLVPLLQGLDEVTVAVDQQGVRGIRLGLWWDSGFAKIERTDSYGDPVDHGEPMRPELRAKLDDRLWSLHVPRGGGLKLPSGSGLLGALDAKPGDAVFVGLSLSGLKAKLDEYEEPGSTVEVYLGPDAHVTELVSVVEALTKVDGTNTWDRIVVREVVLRLEPYTDFPEPSLPEGQEGLEAQAKLRVKSNSDFMACFEREKAKRPELGGRMDVQASISPDGSVMSARVVSSTLNDRNLDRCMTTQFLKMRFAKSPSVQVIRFPFDFR